MVSIDALWGRHSSGESEPRSAYPCKHERSRHQRDSREWEWLRRCDPRKREWLLRQCDPWEWKRLLRRHDSREWSRCGREPDWLDSPPQRSPTLPSLLLSVILVPSLAPISCLKFQISHYSTQLLHLLVFLLELSMPCGTWYRLASLLWPFFEARLFLFLLALPVFASFLPSFSPCGPSRRPNGSVLGVVSWMPFRHFPCVWVLV